MRNVSYLRGLALSCLLLFSSLLHPAQVSATSPNLQPWQHVPGNCPRGTVLSISSEICSGSAVDFGFTSTRIYRPTIVRDLASSTAPCGSLPVTNGQTCYRMWYVGNDEQLRRRIGYAVSSDGVSWQRVQGFGVKGSVLDESNVAGRVDVFGASSATVIKDDNLFKMWYTGIVNGNNIGGIGYATSVDGVTWSRVDGPLLGNAVLRASGVPGTFDVDEVVAPYVIRDQASSNLPCEAGRTNGPCYRMWYEGVEYARNIFSLGYAVSPDGLNWTRVLGPHEGGSVLWRGPNGSFDDNSLGVNSIIKDGDLFRMWYEAKRTDGTQIFSIGSQVSSDGINWVRPVPNLPVFDGSMDPGVFSPDDIWAPVVIKENLRYRMWYSVSSNADSLGLGLAQMTPGSPMPTPTLTRTGTSYTLSFTTTMAIPSNSQILLTPPSNLDLSQLSVGSISGFGAGATIRVDLHAINDAASMNVTRGAMIISVPNGASAGAKTVNFNLNGLLTSPKTLTIQAYGAREVQEYAQLDLAQAVAQADLVVSINNQPSSIAPDTSINYQVVVNNPSAELVTGATLSHIPSNILQAVTWSCSASSGSSCASSGSGAINQTITVQAGGSVTFNISATVPSNATGSFIHNASVSLPSWISDTAPSNNTASASTQINQWADLQLQVSSNSEFVPGQSVSYLLRVVNDGPSDVEQAQISATWPSQLSAVTWTCQAIGNATCPASGSTTLNSLVDLANNSQLEFTINGIIASSATGNFVLNATATEPASVTDPQSSNNSVSLTRILTPKTDLQVRFLNAPTQATAGSEIGYSLEISNTGPSDAIAANVQNTISAALNNISWHCTSSGTSSCTASGTGAINQNIRVQAGQNVIFHINGTINQFAKGQLDLQASASHASDTNTNNNSSQHQTSLQSQGELSITISPSTISVVKGNTFNYTITIQNSGPSAAQGIDLSHPQHQQISQRTIHCTASASSQCPDAMLSNMQLTAGGTIQLFVTATLTNNTNNFTTNAALQIPSDFAEVNSNNNQATLNVQVLSTPQSQWRIVLPYVRK